MSIPHPDFEALSAHHDGEAPEVAAHVAGCATCRATLRWLRATTALVGGPVPSIAAETRDRAIARALDAFDAAESGQATTKSAAPVDRRDSLAQPGPGPVLLPRPPQDPSPDTEPGAATVSQPRSASEPNSVPGPGSVPGPRPGPGSVRGPGSVPGRGSVSGPGPGQGLRPADSAPAAGGDQIEQATPISAARSRRRAGAGMWLGVGSAAAVLVAVVLGIGVLTGGNGGGGDDTTTMVAGPLAGQERTTSGLQGESGPIESSSADNAAGGPGSVAGIDAGDLGQIADGQALAARARPVLLQRDGATAATASGSTEPAGVSGIAATDPAPISKFVGTRPCEMEIRAARPDLGTVVYFATGQVADTQVVVLGFAAGPAPAPVTLLALDQREGCRVVLEAAGP